MDNQFDSKGGPQNVGIGDHAIGQQNNYGVPYEAYGALAGKHAVTEAALASFFKILEEQQVPLHDLDSKLREIAAQHKELLTRVGDNQAAKQAIERGDYAKAEALLEDAAKQHSISTAETYAQLADLQRVQLRYAKAAAYWQKAAALLPEESKKERASYLHEAGEDLYRIGKYKEARSIFTQSLTTYREIDDRGGEGELLNDIGGSYDVLGDDTTALQYYKQSLRIRQEIGDKAGEGTTLNNIGLIYRAQGDNAIALKYYKQSLVIRREIGDRAGEGATLNNLATTAYAKGDYATALKYLEQSLAITQEIGDKNQEGVTLSNISLIYNARGDYLTALKYLKQSLTIMQEIDDKAGEAVTRWNIGMLYKDQRYLRKAESYISRAVQLAEELGLPKLEDFRQGLAEVRAKLRGK